MSPSLAREMVGTDDALVGAGKMVFTDHTDRCLFGGVLLDKLGAAGGNWEMVAGTLIFVPMRRFVWDEGLCGWSIEDLLTDGLEPKFWKPKK